MIARYALVAFTAYAVCSLALSRAVVFMAAYSDALSTQRREEWLLGQCLNATFYANMRKHTNVCETVQGNAERSPILSAMHAVAGSEIPAWDRLVCALGVVAAMQALWISAQTLHRNRRRIFKEFDV